MASDTPQSVFPDLMFVTTPGRQGIPGTLPSTLTAGTVEYDRQGTVLPSSADTVQEALGWVETNLVNIFAPLTVENREAGRILTWVNQGGSFTIGARNLVTTLGEALIAQAISTATPGDYLRTQSNGVVIRQNFTADVYTAVAAAPGLIVDAYDTARPLTQHQVLIGGATGQPRTGVSVLEALKRGAPGLANNASAGIKQSLLWDAFTQAWQVADIYPVMFEYIRSQFKPLMKLGLGPTFSSIPLIAFYDPTTAAWTNASLLSAVAQTIPAATAKQVLGFNGTTWTNLGFADILPAYKGSGSIPEVLVKNGATQQPEFKQIGAGFYRPCVNPSNAALSASATTILGIDRSVSLAGRWFDDSTQSAGVDWSVPVGFSGRWRVEAHGSLSLSWGAQAGQLLNLVIEIQIQRTAGGGDIFAIPIDSIAIDVSAAGSRTWTFAGTTPTIGNLETNGNFRLQAKVANSTTIAATMTGSAIAFGATLIA